jgi:hypothetical protein
MKKTVLLSTLILCISMVSAQTPQTSATPDVVPCTGQNSKPLDFGEKSIMFNQSGINLNKYDWSNLNLNCHINKTIAHQKTAKSLKSIAWILGAGGAGFLVGGIMSSGSGRGSGSDGGAGAIIGIGAVSLVGSIPLFIGASNNKKKRDFHLNQVVDYYQKKGW